MKHLPHLLFSFFLAALAAGCASAPSRYYTLNSAAKSDGAPAATFAVVVGPVIIPASADRPQFMIETAPNRVEFDEFNRWAGPLSDGIARVVSRDLSVLLGTPRVATAPMPDFGPSYRVTMHVERFDSVRGEGGKSGEARLDAVWVVQGLSGDSVGSGSTTAREPAPGNGFEALAAAHSRALAKVSADIAAVIRAAAAQKR